MRKIEKKVWPNFFEEILKGNKTYEFRLNDFMCKKGDILVLKEWDPKTKKYTGRIVNKIVSYVYKSKLSGLKFFKREDLEKYGFQIIAFKDYESSN